MPPPPGFGDATAWTRTERPPYTFSLKPTYVMFSRDLAPEPVDLWRYVPDDLRAEVDRDYAPTSAWLTDERNDESGYFTFFERRESLARRQKGS